MDRDQVMKDARDEDRLLRVGEDGWKKVSELIGSDSELKSERCAFGRDFREQPFVWRLGVDGGK